MLEQIGIALLSSLVGGILGFLGGLAVAERQARRAERHAMAAYEQNWEDRRAALLRALGHELDQNETILDNAERGKRFGVTLSVAWAASLELDLSERKLQALPSAYMWMSGYNEEVRGRYAGGLADRVLEQWAHSAANEVRFARTMLAEPEPAKSAAATSRGE